MDGRSLLERELASAAGIPLRAAQAACRRLVDAGMLATDRRGRARYHRVAAPFVAASIAALMRGPGPLRAAADGLGPVRVGPRDAALRRARLCYDHLGGEVAVAITRSMAARRLISLNGDGAALLTAEGLDFVASLGGGAEGVRPFVPPPARLCRTCIDWSERRPHVAGRLGRLLYGIFVRRGRVRHDGEGRALTITSTVLAALDRRFAVRLD